MQAAEHRIGLVGQDILQGLGHLTAELPRLAVQPAARS